MTPESVLMDMLIPCTLRLDAAGSPRGTAFFVTPQYAVTAAHVIRDVDTVVLNGKRGIWSNETDTWKARVADLRPRTLEESMLSVKLSPSPDVALLEIIDGPEHSCALLGTEMATAGTPVIVRGHSLTHDRTNVTAESEHFEVSGELETSDPKCVLLKLGHGQAVQGMSGGPAMSLSTGEVIGMLRSTRDMHASLGGWVVPSPLIRSLWPEVSRENDSFHDSDTRWRWKSRELAKEAGSASSPVPPELQGNVVVGKVEGPLTVFNGGSFGNVNISAQSPLNGSLDNGGR